MSFRFTITGILSVSLLRGLVDSGSLKNCFPKPSKKCLILRDNLITSFQDVHNDYACAERCLDFPECQWWTYHGADDDKRPNTCELLKGNCIIVDSLFSRMDSRCGNPSSSDAVLITGGVGINGKVVEFIEAFDHSGPCQKQDFLTSPMSTELIKRRHSTASVYYIKTIYSCGGIDVRDSITASCVLFDFDRLSWYRDPLRIPDMSVARADFELVYTYGEIYAIGGISNKMTATRSMEIFDPITRRWREGPQMPVKRADHCAVKYRDWIFVTGGIVDDGRISNSTIVYNVTSRRWIELPSMHLARRSHACAFDEDLQGFMVSGGYGAENDQVFDEVCFFNVTSMKWEEYGIAAMNEPRFGHGVTIIENTPIVVGGTNKRKILRSLEEYKNRDSWKTAHYKLRYERKYFSMAKIPSYMMITGCHNSSVIN